MSCLNRLGVAHVLGHRQDQLAVHRRILRIEWTIDDELTAVEDGQVNSARAKVGPGVLRVWFSYKFQRVAHDLGRTLDCRAKRSGKRADHTDLLGWLLAVVVEYGDGDGGSHHDQDEHGPDSEDPSAETLAHFAYRDQPNVIRHRRHPRS